MRQCKPFRVIIVGLGKIGLGYDLGSPDEHIFTHTKACLEHRDFQLVAGVDLLGNRRREFESFAGIKAYASLADVGLRPGQVDLLIIATPTLIRKDMVAQALCLKPKVILLEKPLAATVEEATEIIELCRCHRVGLAVNYFRYFSPPIQQLFQMMSSQHMGALLHSVCRYSNGVLNNASHFVSLLLQWFGPPHNIDAFGEAKKLQSNDIDRPFSFSTGPATNYFFPVNAEYDIGELDLFFQRGRIRFEDYCEKVMVYRSAPDPFFKDYKRLLPLEPEPDHPSLTRYQYQVLDQLKKVLQGNDDLSANAENALATLKVCSEALGET